MATLFFGNCHYIQRASESISALPCILATGGPRVDQAKGVVNVTLFVEAILQVSIKQNLNFIQTVTLYDEGSNSYPLINSYGSWPRVLAALPMCKTAECGPTSLGFKSWACVRQRAYVCVCVCVCLCVCRCVWVYV